MFWQFETATSQIDTLLSGEVTLSQLLDEDDIIQECKAQNQKLLQFLTKAEIVDELVTLIINEPPAELEEKVRFKHANLACELLTSDSPAINDALVTNVDVLNKLCGFLATDKQLNPLLASFFSKVVGLLCVKRTTQLFEYLKARPDNGQADFVTLVLNHIETSALIDLLLRFITGIEDLDMRNDVVEWLSQQKLVSKLVKHFMSGYSCEQQVNAAQFLCDMIKATREHQAMLQEKASPDLLLDELESSSTVADLLENMFGTRTECVLVNGINVLQSLLEYKKHSANIQQQPMTQPSFQSSNNADFEGMPQPMFNRLDGGSEPQATSALDIERLTKGVLQVQSAIIPRLDDFHSILLEPPEKAPIRTTVGVIAKPLGASRLEVVHLIRALLSSNNPDVNKKLIELKTLSVMIDLFFLYPWNNFLHTQCEQSLASIFTNIKSTSPVTSPVAPDHSAPSVVGKEFAIQLAKNVLDEAQLVTRLLEAWTVGEANAAERKPRPGYMGHLSKIANIIVKASEEEAIKESLDNLPENIREQWASYTTTTLAEINKRIETPLVNEVPSQTFEDVTRQENALQQMTKRFTTYQMQQMTKNLCNQIGLASTTEFTELDNIPIQSQVDQLTRINFSLSNEATSAERRDFSLFDVSADRLQRFMAHDSNSSDEDDFLEENSKEPRDDFVFESPEKELFTEKMDVDQQDPWATVNDVEMNDGTTDGAGAALAADPWATDLSKPAADSEDWANFERFDNSFGEPAPAATAELAQNNNPDAEAGAPQPAAVIPDEGQTTSEIKIGQQEPTKPDEECPTDAAVTATATSDEPKKEEEEAAVAAIVAAAEAPVVESKDPHSSNSVNSKDEDATATGAADTTNTTSSKSTEEAAQDSPTKVDAASPPNSESSS